MKAGFNRLFSDDRPIGVDRYLSHRPLSLFTSALGDLGFAWLAQEEGARRLKLMNEMFGRLLRAVGMGDRLRRAGAVGARASFHKDAGSCREIT